ALHGGRSQPQRNRTLEQFKNGQVTALVATNVAARGIHVDDLDLVVNVDPPTDHKDYLHRGGRTARAGGSGSVVTLVLPDQKREFSRLMTHAGIRPRTARITSGDPELATITGAREPSGVPVTIEVPEPAAPAAARPERKPGARPARRSGPRRRSGGGAGSANGSATGTGAGAGAGAGRRRSGGGAGSANGSATGTAAGAGAGRRRGGGGTGSANGSAGGTGAAGGAGAGRRRKRPEGRA
ncbi:MAG: C-terminal helicase domain-containing protein, partial [Actinomycetia bacterium]|nr:C-terminal helicase domain-containing protein [Actinomycetes bacterium]